MASEFILNQRRNKTKYINADQKSINGKIWRVFKWEEHNLLWQLFDVFIIRWTIWATSALICWERARVAIVCALPWKLLLVWHNVCLRVVWLWPCWKRLHKLILISKFRGLKFTCHFFFYFYVWVILHLIYSIHILYIGKAKELEEENAMFIIAWSNRWHQIAQGPVTSFHKECVLRKYTMG